MIRTDLFNISIEMLYRLPGQENCEENCKDSINSQKFSKIIIFASVLYGIMTNKTSCRCYVVFNVVRNETDEKWARCG